jgi:hypothetical protein
MSKFNKKPETKTGRVLNPEGGEAYRPSAKTELMMTCTAFMMAGDGFYAKEKDTAKRINELVDTVAKKDPEFILKLASFARNEMYMRTVPVHLLVRYAMLPGSKPRSSVMWVPTILRRADEPAEAIAHYLNEAEVDEGVEEKREATLKARGKKYSQRANAPIPAFLKKGISLTLNNFDEYQFGKYDRDGKVKLKDVVFLCHPDAVNDEQQALYDKIVKGELSTPETWETYISVNGSTKENWETIIPKMGYMALLRNLRNFVEKKVDIDPVLERLTNQKAVARSKQFPYRFLSASRALTSIGGTKIQNALNKCVNLSVANVPEFRGKTAVFCDNSGSMNGRASDKSTISLKEIAGLFGAVAVERCEDAYVGVFAGKFAWVPSLSRGNVVGNAATIYNMDVGGSTNGWLGMQALISSNIYVDRVFLISDMQLYNTNTSNNRCDVRYLTEVYRKTVNANLKMYTFNLAEYGLLKFPESDPQTCIISGWSDKVYTFASMWEKGPGAMLNAIEDYSPE